MEDNSFTMWLALYNNTRNKKGIIDKEIYKRQQEEKNCYA